MLELLIKTTLPRVPVRDAPAIIVSWLNIYIQRLRSPRFDFRRRSWCCLLPSNERQVLYLVLVPTSRDVRHTRIVHDRVRVVLYTRSDCVAVVCAVKTAVSVLVPYIVVLLSRIVMWCETKASPGLHLRVDGAVGELVAVIVG